MSDARKSFRRRIQEQFDRRAEEIERRMLEILGTGQDLAMWERNSSGMTGDGLRVKTEVVFAVIPGGSTPQVSPEGFGPQCTVYRVSEIKTGKA